MITDTLLQLFFGQKPWEQCGLRQGLLSIGLTRLISIESQPKKIVVVVVAVIIVVVVAVLVHVVVAVINPANKSLFDGLIQQISHYLPDFSSK